MPSGLFRSSSQTRVRGQLAARWCVYTSSLLAAAAAAAAAMTAAAAAAAVVAFAKAADAAVAAVVGRSTRPRAEPKCSAGAV